MIEAIEWLIDMEDDSGETYKEAAKLFTYDAEFNDLLIGLARDEECHHNLLMKAQNHFTSPGGPELESAYLSVDEETRKKIKKPLIDFVRALNRGGLTREETLGHIIRVEYSEWNDIFSYVLSSMKDATADFIDVATNIQQHRRRIERFLEGKPEYAHHLKKIQPLPTLWNENLLVVESNDVVANMLKSVLNKEGSVDLATTGDEALEKISHKFYAAIVSDVDLPQMSGIDLYKTALNKFPNIRARFIFFTGNDDHISFFKKSGVKYLIKPSPIADIRNTVINAITGS